MRAGAGHILLPPLEVDEAQLEPSSRPGDACTHVAHPPCSCVLNDVPLRVASLSAPERSAMAGIEALNVAIARAGEETATVSFNPQKSQDTVLQTMVEKDVGVLGCGRSRSGRACVPLQQRVIVPAIDLPRHLESLGVRTVELLKVDCEGCEVALLATARGRAWFEDRQRVRRVGAEIHTSKMGGFDDAEVSAARTAFERRGCKWSSRVTLC